ncbi:MAG: NADP(H)-dependent aldo-keto reductase [Gammaproteobacteria bacterium]
MRYRTLGNSDIKVSLICLGSMTWGQQNSEAEGHEQMDYALDQGVNFIDTAELYAIPARSETQGRTEEIIGSWLRSRGNRDKVVLASKVAGPGKGWVDHIRQGESRHDRTNMSAALDASLKRLQTDYLDLYQLHWPERSTNCFGKLGYTHQDDSFTPIEETLGVLAEFIQAGKIRKIGLSNETPWGLMKFLQIADSLGLPRVITIQNPYSLLNRSFEIGLAEIAHRERVGLLAYSPLGFGVLSGKYLDGGGPTDRINLFPEYTRYSSPQAVAATKEYVTLARDMDMSPAQMALAYVNSRSFLTSTIIGATNMDQLRENIASVDLHLSDEVLKRIEMIHKKYPNPAP